MMQRCFDDIQEQLQGSVGYRKAERGRFYSRKQSQAETLPFVSTPAQTIRFLPIFSVCLGNGCQRAGFSQWHMDQGQAGITPLIPTKLLLCS